MTKLQLGLNVFCIRFTSNVTFLFWIMIFFSSQTLSLAFFWKNTKKKFITLFIYWHRKHHTHSAGPHLNMEECFFPLQSLPGLWEQYHKNDEQHSFKIIIFLCTGLQE